MIIWEICFFLILVYFFGFYRCFDNCFKSYNFYNFIVFGKDGCDNIFVFLSLFILEDIFCFFCCFVNLFLNFKGDVKL